MLRRLLTRPVLYSMLLCVAMTPACKKTTGETASPADGASAEASNAVTLRYPVTGVALKAAGTVSMEVAGAQAGNMSITGEAEYSFEPMDDTHLKVVGRVVAVEAVSSDGVMKDQFGDMDVETLIGDLAGQTSYWVIDLKGEDDDEMAKALPENVAKAAEAKARAAAKEGEEKPAEGEEPKVSKETVVTALGSQFLDLARPPEFPVPSLVFGDPTKTMTEEKDINLFGQEIPMEFEKAYSITAPAGEGDGAISSLAIEVVASGAKEMSQGGQSAFVAVDQEVSGTIEVEPSMGIPRASKLDILMTISFGEMVIEQNIAMDLRYSAK